MNLETIKETFMIAFNYPHIKKVGVFGSYAREEQHSRSDLDILLEYDDSSDEFMDDLGGFMEDIEKTISCDIDYVTLNGLIRGKDTNFKEQVLKEVKWLYIANPKERDTKNV